jgi:tetratricopeptide (TPR) repeat protein
MSTLGQASLGLGQYAEAAKALDAALSTAQELPVERHGLLSRIGEAYYHLGDYNRARHYFTAALDEEQLVPKVLLSPDKTANIRYWLAFIAYAQHDLSSARRELDAALTIVKDEQLRKDIETRRRALGD